MEANKINNLSLDGQGSFSNNNIHPDIEPIVEHINDLLQDGNSLQEVVYNLAQETYQLDEISAALEHLGYKPDAIADMFQEIEMAANQQPEMEQPQAGQPESDEQLPEVANQLLNKMQNPQQPSMGLGGMAPAGFDFGFALKDFINEIKGTSDQHLDGTLGSKRHRWKVNFKGANVNPKDYYVTSQGELRNSKEDKEEKMKKQAEMDDDDPAAYKEFIPYQGKKVGSTYFNDWLSANKPKIKDLPFEQSLKSEDNPFGINYNPFAINQKIKSVQPQGPTEMGEDGPIKKPSMLSTKTGGFEEWYNARNAPKGPTEMGDFGPVKKQNMLRTGMKYGGYFQEGGESYTVKSGDVLSQIAIDNNIPVKDILNANPGLEPDKIQIGQSLVLPKQINDLQNVAKKASKRTYKVSDRLEKQRENRKNKIYNDLKSKYIKDLMIQENATKDGWDEEKQLWFPIKAPEGEEGNLDDIGFGYKMSPEEKKLFKNGITNEKLMSLVNKVLKEKEQVAKKYFNDKNYGVNWDELDAPAQILLTDYAYNGALSDFKKFPKAIAEKDKATMLKEYERSSDGKLLTERNKWTKKFIEDNFKYGGLYEASEGIETNEKDKKCLTGNCPPTGLDAKMNSYLKTDAVSDSLQLYNNPDLNNPFSKQAFERLSKYNKEPYIPGSEGFLEPNSNAQSQLMFKLVNDMPAKKDSELGIIIDKKPNYDTDLQAYLKRENLPYSYSDRKKLASEYGIKNYSGTSNQNIDLLNKIKNNVSSLIDLEKEIIIPKEAAIPQTPITSKESTNTEKPLRSDYIKYRPVITGYKIDPKTGKKVPVYKDQGNRLRDGNMNENVTAQNYYKYGGDLPKAQDGKIVLKNADEVITEPESFYDYAKKEYNYFINNPEMWNEDPDMMNEDGSFKFCLDCLNKDYNNIDHLNGIVRLMQEGLTEGPHNTEWANELDQFHAGLKKYNIKIPTLKKHKYGGDLEKYQFAGSVPMLPRVNPIPNQSFSDIEPIDFIGGGTQFNTANANTFTNPMNTSNSIGPIGPTGIPGGASGQYYLGNTGPGSGMGAMNFENMNMEDLRNQYMNSQKPVQNTNSEFPSSIDLAGGQAIEDIESGMYDWKEGEDAGAWDQDPTVKRKRTVGTAISNAENWLKNSKPARIFGSAANLTRAGAGVLNSLYDNTKSRKREEEQRSSMMTDKIARIYTDKEINARQSAQTGLFGEEYQSPYEVAKYGSEIYRNGGGIANWFEQNNIPRAQEGMEVEIDNDTLAALIAAGADIEML